MSNLMMRMHDQFAAQAAQQVAVNPPPVARLPDSVRVTEQDIDRWIEARRQLPVTAAWVAAEREILVAWMQARNCR